jgi:hypothetical protein
MKRFIRSPKAWLIGMLVLLSASLLDRVLPSAGAQNLGTTAGTKATESCVDEQGNAVQRKLNDDKQCPFPGQPCVNFNTCGTCLGNAVTCAGTSNPYCYYNQVINTSMCVPYTKEICTSCPKRLVCATGQAYSNDACSENPCAVYSWVASNNCVPK